MPKLCLIFLFFPPLPASADWIRIDDVQKNVEWNLPAKSGGKYKYVSERYIAGEGAESFKMEKLIKYDCHSLKYFIVLATEKHADGKSMALPNASIWYTIKKNSRHHENLIKHGVCQK